MTNNASYINQDSGNTEYYTDAHIIEASHRCLFGIDLDPASSPVANKTVKAKRFFTKEQDGLSQSWSCRTLWMNHPFHRGWTACTPTCKRKTCITRGYHIYEDIPSNLNWITKLVDEYESGNIRNGAICITFANTSETWFRKLLPYPQCFPRGRINYRNPDGTINRGVTKGSVITYLGRDLDRFKECFEHIGDIKILY